MPRAAGSPGIKAPGRGPDGPGGIRPRVPASSGQGLGAWQPYDLTQLSLICTTIRYVRKTGSDSNGGTGPSDAWLTINHALNTVSPGTIIYVGAGVYREQPVVTNSFTPTTPCALVADVDGSHTGDAGMVMLTAFLTNDMTASASGSLLTINGSGGNMYFHNILFVGASGNPFMVQSHGVAGGSVSVTNCVFRDCAFIHTAPANANNWFELTATAGLPLNWLFDRCLFAGVAASTLNAVFLLTVPRATVQDYDVNVRVQNSLAITGGGSQFVRVASSGSATFKGGGFRVRGSSFYMPNATMLYIADANVSSQYQNTIYGCFYWGHELAVANVSGQVVEDYNLYLADTANTNVPAGQHSKSGGFAPLIHFGQEQIWGGMFRPFGEPMVNSPLQGFGLGDSINYGLDLRRGPRQLPPTVAAVGAFQRGNNLSQETSTVRSGANAVSLTGPGFQDFQVRVSSGQLTPSIYCQYDSNYTGQPPQFQVLANEAISVGAASVDFPNAQSGTWQQAAIILNPTGNGIVVVRVVSNDNSGASKVVFDSFAAA